MPYWDAGISTNYGSYTLRLNAWENTNEGANYSTISFYLEILKNSTSGYSYNLDCASSWYINIAGYEYSGCTAYDFRNGVMQRTIYGTQTTGAIYHNADGTKSINVNASFSGPGPLYSADIGWPGWTLTDFNRYPAPPAALTLSRDTNGTRVRIQTSSYPYNNGPGIDFYRIYGSSDGGASWPLMWDTGSGNSLDAYWTGLSATSTYWFHVYAHNADGFSRGHSGVYSIAGAPAQPNRPTVSTNTSNDNTVNLSWSAPSSNLTITQYDLYRNGGFLKSLTGSPPTTSTTDNTSESGNSHTYTVYAYNSSGWSSQSNASDSVIVPGPPATPSQIYLTYSGRNATVSVDPSPNFYNVPINYQDQNQGYFIQYQTSASPSGPYGDWSTAVRMSDQATRTHRFELLSPALYYKFRVYAANSIVNNKDGVKTYYPNNGGTLANSIETSSVFLSAGGRRYRSPGEPLEGTFQPTETAKRWDSDTNNWVALNTAKRWDPTLNNNAGGWATLT